MITKSTPVRTRRSNKSRSPPLTGISLSGASRTLSKARSMASEPFGRGPGQVVPDRGDVDAIIDGLLDRIRRFFLCLAGPSFWLGSHALIVAVAAGGIKERSQQRAAGLPGVAGRTACSWWSIFCLVAVPPGAEKPPRPPSVRKHTMTRNDQRHRIAGHDAAYGASGIRTADLPGQVAVSLGLAESYHSARLQDLVYERACSA